MKAGKVQREMTRLTLSLLLFLFLLAPAWAQAPDLPQETEVSLEFRDYLTGEGMGALWDHFMRLPFARVLLSELKKETGLKVDRSWVNWLGDEFYFAVIRLEEESPISRVIRRGQLKTRYRDVRWGCQSLGEAIQEFTTQEQRLPKDFEELENSEHLYAGMPTAPEGVAYRYVVGAEGEFKVYTHFDEDAPIAEVGPPPSYTPEGGLEPAEMPDYSEGPLNFVLVAEVRRADKAKEVMQQLLPDSRKGFWRVGYFTLTLRDRWLVLTDNPSTLGPTLASLGGKGQGLSHTESYRRARAFYPQGPELFMFVDIEKILRHSRMSEIEEPIMKDAVAAVKTMSLASFIQPRKVTSDAVLEIRAEGDHPFVSLLEESGPKNYELLNSLPWDVANVYTLDLWQGHRLIRGLGQLHPMGDLGVAMGNQMLEQVTGHSLDSLRSIVDGEVLISYEQLDFLWIGLVSELKKDLSPAHTLPLTVGMRLKPGADVGALEERLEDFLGDEPESYEVAGVKVRRSEDGLFAVARAEQLLLVSGGGTFRLLEAVLQAHQQRKASLASLASTQVYFQGERGRRLLYVHQKVDWLYMMAKGLLLLMGADYRPAAEQVGIWRDIHSSVTVVPEGIRFRQVLYPAD